MDKEDSCGSSSMVNCVQQSSGCSLVQLCMHSRHGKRQEFQCDRRLCPVKRSLLLVEVQRLLPVSIAQDTVSDLQVPLSSEIQLARECLSKQPDTHHDLSIYLCEVDPALCLPVCQPCMHSVDKFCRLCSQGDFCVEIQSRLSVFLFEDLYASHKSMYIRSSISPALLSLSCTCHRIHF